MIEAKSDNKTGETGFDPLEGLTQMLDRESFALIAHLTQGIAPTTIVQSWSDWAMHVLASPGKRLQMNAKAGHKVLRLFDYLIHGAMLGNAPPVIEPLPQDQRFDDPAWRSWPYNIISQTFLLNQQWWHAATTDVLGVSSHHEAVVSFMMRQMLDTLAPTNFPATNPVLQQRILETQGQCLVKGLGFLLEDIKRNVRGEPPVGAEAFRPGETVAVTPGKVVWRNELMELIQYTPTTATVRPEPVLIVPAWIMKYYILDLSPENSLVRWLVGEGYTVFVISWRNPGKDQRNLDLDAYRRLGPLAAIDAIGAITGCARLHALGYCLGGTLLSITAAAMARDGDIRLASVTLLAAQTEFSEPGELALFIDEAEVNLIDNMMWSQGYLDSAQMGGAFQLLRSNDLIWSRVLKTYLMGEREPLNDLMAWNSDGTRMPHAMHSEYLRHLFLEDALAEGHYQVDGRAISLSTIQQPIFVVGTERDHVAPWRSVYKIHGLTAAEITFVLTSGGHNAGIVSEPGHPRRHYRIRVRPEGGAGLPADDWLQGATDRQGSWWLAWKEWLDAYSGAPQSPPPMGKTDRGDLRLADAPGQYVLER